MKRRELQARANFALNRAVAAQRAVWNNPRGGGTNVTLTDGRRARAIGEPFRVNEHPPGVTWLACVVGHRIVPVAAEEVRADG